MPLGRVNQALRRHNHSTNKGTLQGQQRLISAYRLLFQFGRSPPGFLEGFERFVEFGDNDGHGEGEEDHGTEHQDTCNDFSQSRLGIHVPVADLIN